jgi:hypothetical protein
MGVEMVNTRSDRSTAIKDSLLFILFFNAVFWILAAIVSTSHLYGQECFERVFPVVVGGTCVALAAVISAWRQRRNRNEE